MNIQQLKTFLDTDLGRIFLLFASLSVATFVMFAALIFADKLLAGAILNFFLSVWWALEAKNVYTLYQEETKETYLSTPTV